MRKDLLLKEQTSEGKLCVPISGQKGFPDPQGCAPKISEIFGSEFFGNIPKVSGLPL